MDKPDVQLSWAKHSLVSLKISGVDVFHVKPYSIDCFIVPGLSQESVIKMALAFQSYFREIAIPKMLLLRTIL